MTDYDELARRIAEKAVDQRWMIERMDSEEAPMYMDRLVAIIARELREALPTSEACEKPECDYCGGTEYYGELRVCPFCDGTKCSLCDMGDDVECEMCLDDEDDES